jgi:hypothetical protein
MIGELALRLRRVEDAGLGVDTGIFDRMITGLDPYCARRGNAFRLAAFIGVFT